MMLSLKQTKILNGIWSLSDDRNSTFRISVPGEWERQVENNLNIFSLFLEMQ
jgi:hypothetical protein